MTRRRRSEESKGGAPDWLTTYSDLVTLLLCFFILLFSFSSVDAEKFRSIMASFQGGSGVLSGSTSLDFPINTNEEALDVDTELEEDLENLKTLLQEYSNELGDLIVVDVDERGIIIRFLDKVFFDSGKADIKPESIEILDSIAEILNRDEFLQRHIKIEGHTDSDPIISGKYPTNWELSSARAINVLRYLVERANIGGNRISSSGYSHFRNIAPNDTSENKAKNRRVDIIILKTSAEELEP